MSELRTDKATGDFGAHADGWDFYFGEFDLTCFGRDLDESVFLPSDLSALSTAELERLCDQAFEELDTPLPSPAAKDNYEVLTEELDQRQANDSQSGTLMVT